MNTSTRVSVRSRVMQAVPAVLASGLVLVVGSASGAHSTRENWSAPVPVAHGHPALAANLTIDGSGTAIASWEFDAGLWMSRRPAGGSWSKPTYVDPDASSGSSGRAPTGQLAVDPLGNACVLYTSFYLRELRVACLDRDGTLTPPHTLASQGRQPHLQLVVDASGTWTAGWIQRQKGRTWVDISRRAPSGTWTLPHGISAPSQAASSLQLATTPGGAATAVWASKPQNNPKAGARILTSTRTHSTAWSKATPISPPHSERPSLAGGTHRRVLVTWIHSRGGSAVVQVRQCHGITWGSVRTVSAPAFRPIRFGQPHVAVGGRGVAVAGWRKFGAWCGNHTRAYAAVFEHGRWQAVTPLTREAARVNMTATYSDPVFTVDSRGTVHSFVVRNNDLQARKHRVDTSWRTGVSIGRSNSDYGQPPSPALSPTGKPAVLWLHLETMQFSEQS